MFELIYTISVWSMSFNSSKILDASWTVNQAGTSNVANSFLPVKKVIDFSLRYFTCDSSISSIVIPKAYAKYSKFYSLIFSSWLWYRSTIHLYSCGLWKHSLRLFQNSFNFLHTPQMVFHLSNKQIKVISVKTPSESLSILSVRINFKGSSSESSSQS